MTTKKLYTKAIVHELLWFLRGESNARSLQDLGVHIWDEWAAPNGDLGPVYGKQWRSWSAPDGTTIDQMARLIETCAATLSLVVSSSRPGTWRTSIAWPSLPATASSNSTWRASRLSCQLYQRSGDVFLGVPFNIASYSLLTHMVAQACGLQAHEFVHTLGDAHIYLNHLDQVRLQLQREPRALPALRMNPAVRDLFRFAYEDITFENYNPHPSIRGDIAV